MAYVIKDEKGQPVKHDGNEVFAVDMVGAVKSIDKGSRSLVIVGSDETKDRDGDIIMVNGWKMDNFLKNPVFLYAHDHSGVPIGSATKVIRRKNPPRLEFHEKFPSEGIYPFADMILSLFQEKVLNASSVGFIPTKWEELEKDDSSNNFWPGRKFTEQELLELSACAVPSNPSALQVNSLAKSLMSKSMNEIKEMLDPKDRDLILEQLFVKEIEFEDETSFMVQVPGQIVKEETFVTVKGEFENKSIEEEEKLDMEIKELLEQISGKLDNLSKLDEVFVGMETFGKGISDIAVEMAEIKSFITNLTKTPESDKTEDVEEKTTVSDDKTEDLYKELLSQPDNKEVLDEKKEGVLSSEEEEILKQVIANLKENIK
jgi:uncharacterized protein